MRNLCPFTKSHKDPESKFEKLEEQSE